LANVKLKAQDNAKVEELFQAKLKEKGFFGREDCQDPDEPEGFNGRGISKEITYENWLKTTGSRSTALAIVV
jgi:hypothetical protein